MRSAEEAAKRYMSLQRLPKGTNITSTLNDIRIPNPTDEYIEECLNLDGRELQYVSEERRSDYFCKLAINNDPSAINIITNPSYELWELSISKDGNSIRFLENQTHELCMMAVAQNPASIMFIRDQTLEIIKCALHQDYNSFKYVKTEIPTELILFVVRKNGMLLRHVNNQTHEICLAAVSTNGTALQFVKDQSQEICDKAFKQNPLSIEYMDDKFKSKDICNQAINNDNYTLLRYVPNPSTSDIRCAVEHNGGNLRYAQGTSTFTVCNAEDRELFLIAVNQHPWNAVGCKLPNDLYKLTFELLEDIEDKETRSFIRYELERSKLRRDDYYD